MYGKLNQAFELYQRAGTLGQDDAFIAGYAAFNATQTVPWRAAGM